MRATLLAQRTRGRNSQRRLCELRETVAAREEEEGGRRDAGESHEPAGAERIPDCEPVVATRAVSTCLDEPAGGERTAQADQRREPQEGREVRQHTLEASALRASGSRVVHDPDPPRSADGCSGENRYRDRTEQATSHATEVSAPGQSASNAPAGLDDPSRLRRWGEEHGGTLCLVVEHRRHRMRVAGHLARPERSDRARVRQLFGLRVAVPRDLKAAQGAAVGP